MISDELFESYAAEEEAAASKSYKSGDFESRDYEEVKWVGCDINKPTIFRAVEVLLTQTLITQQPRLL